MSDVIELDLDLPEEPTDDDNITDWCLEQFHGRYGDHITKDDVWEYLYGVMHAPDWRERYKHDLQRNLPRIPLADDFEAFRATGRKLMDLHINYETCDEHPLTCQCWRSPTAANSSTSPTRRTNTPSRAAHRSTGPSTASATNTTSPPASPTTPTAGTTGLTNPST